MPIAECRGGCCRIFRGAVVHEDHPDGPAARPDDLLDPSDHGLEGVLLVQERDDQVKDWHA